MKRGSWDLKVDAVEMLHAPGASTKRASTQMTLSNLAGKDKSFTPTREIIAFVGTSCKVYRDFKKMSLIQWYEGTKQLRKEISEREAGSMPYEEGVFRWGIAITVDVVETGITAIIYADENVKEHKIPVSIEPIINESSPSAK